MHLRYDTARGRVRAKVRETKIREVIIAKFHYTDPTGPARTFLQPGSPRNSVGPVRVSDKVRSGPCGPVQWNLALTYQVRSGVAANTITSRINLICYPKMDVAISRCRCSKHMKLTTSLKLVADTSGRISYRRCDN